MARRSLTADEVLRDEFSLPAHTDVVLPAARDEHRASVHLKDLTLEQARAVLEAAKAAGVDLSKQG